MNADKLLAHFEKIGDAPDAVDRLRRFTRSLAVRGLLVGGNERAFLSRESDSVSEVNDECPWQVPRSWKWTSVSSTADYRFGKMLDKAKNRGTPRRYLRNVNVRWYDFDLTDVLEMRFEDHELPEYSLHGGDVLICEGGEPGRAAIWDEREEGLLFQKAIHRVRFGSTVAPSFFLLALREAADSERLSKLFTGVTIKHLTGKGLGRFAFPLPPLAEQHRIVEKVDELMLLCDQLEASQNERETRRNRLVVSSLNRLGNPSGSDADEFKKDAGFHLRNLNRLATKPEHIKELRKAILNLAVRGRLTSERPIVGGLPSDWLLSSVEEVGDVKLGRQRSPKDHHGPHMVPYLRVANVYDGYLSLSDVKAMNFTPEEQEVFRLRPGDVLLNEGQSRELVGRPAIYRGEIEGCCFQNTLLRFRCGSSVTSDYALLVFRSYLHCGRFQRAATQTTNMAHLSASRLKAIEFPLPPLAEQKRIVAKVDELMAICDQLEKQLESQQKESRRLLEALLHEALEGVG